MTPRSNHRREVTPQAVVEGNPEQIVKEDLANLSAAEGGR
jgi:hypothetical protein